MKTEIEQMQAARLDWEQTPQSAYLFSSVFKSRLVYLRLNDFPDEPLCTVVLEDQEIDLEDFPKNWTLPKHREKKNIQNQNISAAG